MEGQFLAAFRLTFKLNEHMGGFFIFAEESVEWPLRKMKDLRFVKPQME